MNNNRIILENYSKGTFGNIFKDSQLNVYKVTIVCEGGILTVSNINEIVFFNKLAIIKNYLIENKNNSKENKLVLFEEESYKDIINENIFMQTISTKYYDFESLIDTFMFTNHEMDYKYKKLLTNKIEKYLLFSKMPRYKANLSKFIAKYHIYSLNNFDIIAKKLIKSLAFLHQNGFLHGDLKTVNILIDDVENVCLTDFGAIKLANLDCYHLSCTISSRCPEDLAYEHNNTNKFKNSNYKSDIWSLGLVFAEIVLGYNPILKLYQKFEKTGMSIKTIEANLLNYYDSIKYINILELVEINSLINSHLDYNLLNKIVAIEKMLVVDPNTRLSTLDEVYEKLFNEKINFNYKLTFDYDYKKNYKEEYFKYFLQIRKNNYIKIIDACDILNILYMVPLIIDIIDRLIIKLIDKINKKSIELNDFEIKIIFCAIILLVGGIYNQTQPSYNEILNLFSLKNDVSIIANINRDLLDILEILDYDIYRPFNIYYCSYQINKYLCECKKKDNEISMNENNTYIIHSIMEINKLKKILIEIIENNIFGISPTFYHNKLIENIDL